MALRRIYFQTVLFVALLLAVGGLNVPYDTAHASKDNGVSLKEADVNEAIVLIGFNGTGENQNFYGITPIADKDILSLIEGNSTIAHKVIGNARNIHWKAENAVTGIKDQQTESRLLPLISTSKKALLLFALHGTLLKGLKGESKSNCVVLSKDDLLGLLEAEETSTGRAVEIKP